MVDNDFINDDETLLNSETDQSYDNVEETQDSVNESVRYMQSEKDKALAENEKLKKQIQEIQESLASQQQQPVDNKINPDDFDFYVDGFRYGAPPHAGWGLGVARLLMVLTGAGNVRETVLFPRDRKRCTP